MSFAVRFAAAALVILAAGVSQGATFTVTSGADSGPGTLQQAILDANATPGRDQIVITVDVLVNVTPSLPTITDPVDIEGVGGVRSIIKPFTGEGTTAFRFGTGSSGSTLRNIRVEGFHTSVAVNADVSGVTVTNATTDFVTFNGSGNVFSGGRITVNLAITGANNEIVGSTIRRIHLLFAVNTRLGRSGSGNTIETVEMDSATATTIEGNTFTGGITAIDVRGPVVPSIGTTIAGNTITGYTTAIVVRTGATGVEITGNTIRGGRAIDLGGDGRTPNDPAPDADIGANNLQNFPVVTSAIAVGTQLRVDGALTSAPLTQYRIELFASPASDPQMHRLLDTFLVTTDASGVATFSRTLFLTTPLAASDVVTATATNTTTRDTSELSAPATVTAVSAEAVPTAATCALIALAGALITVVLLRLR